MFTREAVRIPAAVEDMEVRLFTTAAGEQTVEYSVQVRFSDDSLAVRTGDLLPHLSAQRIASLSTFLADLRIKAAAEFLP